MVYKNECRKERSKSMNTLFQKYSLERISMGDSYTGNSYARNIEFLFDTKDTGYDYWGIYYSENDTIILWEVSPYEEDNGIYRQNGSYYKYETEKITGKWYLYKCNVF